MNEAASFRTPCRFPLFCHPTRHAMLTVASQLPQLFAYNNKQTDTGKHCTQKKSSIENCSERHEARMSMSGPIVVSIHKIWHKNSSCLGRRKSYQRMKSRKIWGESNWNRQSLGLYGRLWCYEMGSRWCSPGDSQSPMASLSVTVKKVFLFPFPRLC